MTATRSRTSPPLIRTACVRVLAAAAVVLAITVAAAPVNASHGSTRSTPSWQFRVNFGAATRAPFKSVHQRGFAAGQRAGKQAGYAAGLHGNRFHPSPTAWMPKKCNVRFARGFRQGFRRAYRRAYQQGVHSRRHCWSW